MAEMFQPKKQTLKKSDYNKAIVKANDRLKSKNKALESSIKDKEKELKSLDKEYNSATKKLASLSNVPLVSYITNFFAGRADVTYVNVAPGSSIVSPLTSICS